jgi:hypothetical protein
MSADDAENRTLRAEVIVKTIAQLEERIRARFGERGLTRAARDLAAIARRTQARVEAIRRPYWGLRLAAYSVLALAAAGLFRLQGFYTVLIGGNVNLLEFAQGLEATMNILLISSIILLFIVGGESRLKRARSLAGLHELRSIAHVIDMHQLTKAPSAFDKSLKPTPVSPVRDLTAPQMVRYLDYCSEMLSLVAKLAALYAEGRRDAVVIDAVNDIESLTSNLSRKIWQKIAIISEAEHMAPVRTPAM